MQWGRGRAQQSQRFRLLTAPAHLGTHTEVTVIASGDGLLETAWGTSRRRKEGIQEAGLRKSFLFSVSQRRGQSWGPVILQRLSPTCREGMDSPVGLKSPRYPGPPTQADSQLGRENRFRQLHPLYLGPNSRMRTLGKRQDSEPLLLFLACKLQWPNLPNSMAPAYPGLPPTLPIRTTASKIPHQ